MSSQSDPENVAKEIQDIIAVNLRAGVVTDVTIIDLRSGQTIADCEPNQEQFAASVNKVPVAELLLIDLRAGSLDFSQQLTWPADQVLPGTGVYDQPGAPTTATLQELFFDMLNHSGNTAVNVFVQDVLGGAAVVNDRFKNDLHLIHTYLQPLDDGNFYLGNTASGEAVSNIQRLLDGNDEYQQFVYNALSTDIFTNYGVQSQMGDFPDQLLASKVGFLNDPSGNNRHDVGIIYDQTGAKLYAFAILTTAQGEEYEYPTAQGGVSLAYIGRALLSDC